MSRNNSGSIVLCNVDVLKLKALLLPLKVCGDDILFTIKNDRIYGLGSSVSDSIIKYWYADLSYLCDLTHEDTILVDEDVRVFQMNYKLLVSTINLFKEDKIIDSLTIDFNYLEDEMYCEGTYLHLHNQATESKSLQLSDLEYCKKNLNRTESDYKKFFITSGGDTPTFRLLNNKLKRLKASIDNKSKDVDQSYFDIEYIPDRGICAVTSTGTIVIDNDYVSPIRKSSVPNLVVDSIDGLDWDVNVSVGDENEVLLILSKHIEEEEAEIDDLRDKESIQTYKNENDLTGLHISIRTMENTMDLEDETNRLFDELDDM